MCILVGWLPRRTLSRFGSVPELHNVRRSPDLLALKLWKGWSGCMVYPRPRAFNNFRARNPPIGGSSLYKTYKSIGGYGSFEIATGNRSFHIPNPFHDFGALKSFERRFLTT